MESISSLLRRTSLWPLHGPSGELHTSTDSRESANNIGAGWMARLRKPPLARALPKDLPERARALDLCAQGSQWLRYRDGRAAMAASFLRCGRGIEALEQWLEVWYIDLNGPRNALPPSEALLLSEEPLFDARQGATRAGVRRQVRHLMGRMRLEVEDIQVLYFAATTTMHRRHGLPLTPVQAWQAIAAQLLD